MIDIKNEEELNSHCLKHYRDDNVAAICKSPTCILKGYALCADRILAPSIVREQNRQKTLQNILIYNRKEKLEKLLS